MDIFYKGGKGKHMRKSGPEIRRPVNMSVENGWDGQVFDCLPRLRSVGIGCQPGVAIEIRVSPQPLGEKAVVGKNKSGSILVDIFPEPNDSLFRY